MLIVVETSMGDEPIEPDLKPSINKCLSWRKDTEKHSTVVQKGMDKFLEKCDVVKRFYLNQYITDHSNEYRKLHGSYRLALVYEAKRTVAYSAKM